MISREFKRQSNDTDPSAWRLELTSHILERNLDDLLVKKITMMTKPGETIEISIDGKRVNVVVLQVKVDGGKAFIEVVEETQYKKMTEKEQQNEYM